MTKVRIVLAALFLAVALRFPAQAANAFDAAFMNFETAPVHPIDLSPDHSRLAICNLADGKLEIFDVTSGNAVHLGSVPVGLDPVSVRFRTNNEAWVVNHVSDSISVVDLSTLRVRATIGTLDTPSDVVFAGTPARAFVSCAFPNALQVFDLNSHSALTNISLKADRPKSLATSPDGQRVYVAFFESGNGTTIVAGKFDDLAYIENPVGMTNSPYGGQNPPPNDGLQFNPPLNPAITDAPPATGIIVRKNDAGRWMDDNHADWTEFISGTNAALTERVAGWDMPDRDVAVVDAATYDTTYVSGLMNLCMELSVNPASGQIAVIGTDAINEVRFEPNVNGVFVRVKLATIDPSTFAKSIHDLNPHLDYSAPRVPEAQRDLSVGDPRDIIWTADGSVGYVAGMGSRNVVRVDAQGNRLPGTPIELGEGPCGLALDESHQRLYVFNRFSSSLSVVDTVAQNVIAAIPLFDPTPLSVAAGRKHLYDTRRTSGLGQASCASCHADARMDRLAWDLGNPAGELERHVVNTQLGLNTNSYHPMKGVMVTQTLQDIIGHEPFHWRGDRPHIGSFNPAFTNLLGGVRSLTDFEMSEFRDTLASIRFPPNPFRSFDDSFPTNLPLPGHFASGENVLPAGAALPNGNARTGFDVFFREDTFCGSCHTLPTGLSFDGIFKLPPVPLPPGPNGEHHFALAPRLEGPLFSKIAQIRNMADKVGMDKIHTESRAGFGFGHDGSVDSMTHFLEGVRVVTDQDIADLTAFLFSISGSQPFEQGIPDPSPPAAVGRQLTLAGTDPFFEEMLAVARTPNSRVELIAKGHQNGIARGWLYLPGTDRFQSDRLTESLTPAQLSALAAPEAEITLTMVAYGSGVRLGIDRDLDSVLDRDELDSGANPATGQLKPVVIVPGQTPVGASALLNAHLPPLIAPASFSWYKDDQLLPGETNTTLELSDVQFAGVGDYRFVVTTAFQSNTSAPVRLGVVPAVVTISPSSLNVRQTSNAVFTTTTEGAGPFQYQWRFNGSDSSGATSDSLFIANAQLANEGMYQVRVANAHGAVTSAPVRLTLLINPAVVTPPINQRVVAGANATFSFMVSGNPAPFGFLLRRGANVLTNYSSTSPVGFLTLFNVQPADAGTYRIVVTNAANPSPGLSMSPVTLTILDDTDGDGLPDEWENSHGLNAASSADASLDSDHDGQTNSQEYQAGTDPQDPNNSLRIERFFLIQGTAQTVLEFNAAAERGYTLEYRDELKSTAWQPASIILPELNSRLISITNTVTPGASRYFRLSTHPSPPVAIA